MTAGRTIVTVEINQPNRRTIEMTTGNLVTRIAVTLAAAGIAGACGSDETSSPATAAPVTAAPATTVAATTVPHATIALATTPPAAGDVLFSDDLADDSNKWGVVDDPQFGTAKFIGGDYVWDFRGSLAHWLPGVLGDKYDAGELEMRDVVVNAELTINSGGGVAGVFCRESPDTDAEWQWYDFVLRDGYAAIRQADLEGNITPLAENREIALPLGTRITIEATCQDDPDGAATLWMAVNGAPLLETVVDDSPLGNGVPGMSAWTFPTHEQMDIVWHSFSVRSAA
jgi:hypothetical protein